MDDQLSARQLTDGTERLQDCFPLAPGERQRGDEQGQPDAGADWPQPRARSTSRQGFHEAKNKLGYASMSAAVVSHLPDAGRLAACCISDRMSWAMGRSTGSSPRMAASSIGSFGPVV